MSTTNPSYYSAKKIQPIEYILANDMNFLEGNIVKYVTRYKEKNGIEHLEKARWYLERLITENGNIPQEQIDIANKTRKHINKIVGQYRDYKNAGANPDNITSDFIKKHYRNLASIGILLQWVAGDSKKAEHSFININK